MRVPQARARAKRWESLTCLDGLARPAKLEKLTAEAGNLRGDPDWRLQGEE